MITRDDLQKRADHFNTNGKCSLYIETENDNQWICGTGDIALQIYAISEFLISRSSDKMTAHELARVIVDFIDHKTKG